MRRVGEEKALASFADERPYEREFNGIQKFEPLSRSHEGFVDVLQIGRNDEEGYFYYVMELADGVEQPDQVGVGQQHLRPKGQRAALGVLLDQGGRQGGGGDHVTGAARGQDQAAAQAPTARPIVKPAPQAKASQSLSQASQVSQARPASDVQPPSPAQATRQPSKSATRCKHALWKARISSR